MKRATKISLIIAAALCFVGLLIAAMGFWLAGFSFGNFGAADAVTNTLSVTEPFTNIAIDVDEADVRFVLSNDGACKVVWEERENVTHSATVQNGTLLITCTDDRKWYEYVGIYAGRISATVYLPENNYKELTINTNTGDVTLPDTISFEEVEVETDTGDVLCQTPEVGRLSVSTDTGDVKVESLAAASLSAETETGSVTLRRVHTQAGIRIAVDTGDVALEGVTCGALSVESDTGDVTLTSTVAKEHLSIETDTGDVTLEASDTATLFIKTATGDVEGSLLTPKRFRASSSTGSIRIPDSDAGGLCEITTSTGDIEMHIK